MAAATRRKKKLDFPIMQFLAVLTVSMVLFLLFGFTHRAALNYRVQQRKAHLEQQYMLLVQENAQLTRRFQEVQTDAYVEQLARRELRWSRPGEKMVVIVAPPQAGAISTGRPETSSAPVPVPETSAPPTIEPLDRWLELFFPTEP